MRVRSHNLAYDERGGEDGGAHVFNYLWAFNGPFNYFGDDKRMELITGSLDL